MTQPYCIKYSPEKWMRNETSAIIRGHICPVFRSEIIKQLNQSPFSISADESTDIHGSSYLEITAN